MFKALSSARKFTLLLHGGRHKHALSGRSEQRGELYFRNGLISSNLGIDSS